MPIVTLATGAKDLFEEARALVQERGMWEKFVAHTVKEEERWWTI